MADTTIEWTRGDDGRPGATWNPVRGCSRVSEGCRHCFAERQAARFCGPGQPYEGLATAVAPRDDLDRVGGRRAGWTGVVRLVPEHLTDPLRWRRPRRVFVNSMSDLFHEALSDEDIAAVFGVMAACPQHTFQVLTKRAERMRAWMTTQGVRSLAADRGPPYARPVWPLPNVHFGVSVEDQTAADARIPHLLACPAAVRWISYEPAIGPIDFTPWLRPTFGPNCVEGPSNLSWLVLGGESGLQARPFDLAWARDVIRQCREAHVPVFFKQAGANVREVAGTEYLDERDLRDVPLRDRKGADLSELPEDLRVREWPKVTR